MHGVGHYALIGAIVAGAAGALIVGALAYAFSLPAGNQQPQIERRLDPASAGSASPDGTSRGLAGVLHGEAVVVLDPSLGPGPGSTETRSPHAGATGSVAPMPASRMAYVTLDPPDRQPAAASGATRPVTTKPAPRAASLPVPSVTLDPPVDQPDGAGEWSSAWAIASIERPDRVDLPRSESSVAEAPAEAGPPNRPTTSSPPAAAPVPGPPVTAGVQPPPALPKDAPEARGRDEDRGNRGRHERNDREDRGDGASQARRSETADRLDWVERPYKGERVDKSERADRIERAAKIERPEKVERAERPERVDRIDRTERVERLVRPERVERVERAERRERVERVERREKVEKPERGRR